MSEKLWVDWNTYIQDIYHLGKKIKEAKGSYIEDYVGVYGPPRGGTIPATILAHYLNIPYLSSLEEKRLESETGTLLIIDDISDEGNTFKKISNQLSNKIRYSFIYDVTFASIYFRSTSKFIPNFYVHKIDTPEWIVFPYEEEVS